MKDPWAFLLKLSVKFQTGYKEEDEQMLVIPGRLCKKLTTKGKHGGGSQKEGGSLGLGYGGTGVSSQM